MKIFTKNSLFVLSLVVAFLTIGAIITTAQDKNSKPAKNITLDLVRNKSADLRTEAVTGDPCDFAVEMAIGQTRGGALNNTDCRLDDGSYADFFVFQGVQRQQVTINMGSSDIDSYLGLANMSGTFIIEDDDSGGGLTAQIIATLPETGTYIILANSALPNQFGGYLLRTGSPTLCSYSVSPTTSEVPATGGTFTFNVITQAGCHWRAVQQHAFISTTSSGIGSGTVSYTVAQNGSGQTRTGSVVVSSAPESAGNHWFTITQPSVACSYSLLPPSINIPATQTTASFQIVAPAGCPWSVITGSYSSSPNTTGTGTATITFTTRHNNGAPRTDIIRVGDLNFIINQDGLNCTFTATPQNFRLSRHAATRTLTVNTQPGCIWTALSNFLHINLLNNSGVGAGTITFNVSALTDSTSRWGAIQFSEMSSVVIDQSKLFPTPAFDFDADGAADFSIFRPSVGEWWYRRSSNGQTTAAQFGTSNDKIVPADFTGDAKTDIAIFRPSTGEWFILRSEDGSFYAFPFGTAGDIPVPADYDSDSLADAAIYRPSTGEWFINKSSGGVLIQQFGQTGDVPVVGDYDRDGKADIAIYRPSLGQWWMQRSLWGLAVYQFGSATDKPVPGDYTGDGATDVAFFRPATGEWFIQYSGSSHYYSFPFGTAGDIPAPADYDTDGRFDAGVFRPSSSTWYALRTTGGTIIQQFGATGDFPVPNAFMP